MDNFLRQKRKKNAILKSKELGLRRRLIKGQFYSSSTFLTQTAEWELLTEEQRMVTRSMRAKKGIKCDHCGCVGYFIEICPNECYEPPPPEEVSHHGLARFGSDDDEDTEPKEPTGEGFYWTNTDTHSEIEKPKRSYYPTKADLSSLRQLSLDEKKRLQESDAKLTDYEFHRSAQEGYAQNLSELSLHQALRYFMRILDREIQENVKRLEAKDDLTLFHPPAENLSDHFYPKEVEKFKEYRSASSSPCLHRLTLRREYFHEHAMKKDRQIHSHQHCGALRPEEAMSVYYRAQGEKGGGREMSNKTLALYEPNPQAGQSIHGKIGWKSVLATNDDLAIADPKMAEKLIELRRSEREQSAWTSQQQKSFEFQNERYLHLWHIVKSEILCEHDRERRLLLVDEHANRRETEVGIWKERNEAADRLIETLKGYGYLRGTNEADYIIKGMEMWKAEMAKSRKRLQEGGTMVRRRGKGRKAKLKRVGGEVKIRSMVRAEERTNQGGDESATDEEHTDIDHLENESPKKSEGVESHGRPGPVNKVGSAGSKAGKGGYCGLGLLSTVGAKETTSPLESSTQVTGQLLMRGALGLVSDPSCSSGGIQSPQASLLLPSTAASKSFVTVPSMTSSRKTKSSTSVGGNTMIAKKRAQERQMELLATRYT
jgi:hypothetical protein